MEANESTKKGWRGTVRAMLTHHPDKFGDEPGKINPWALVHSMANKGAEPHYKDQKSSLKGTPKKKKEYKNEWLSWTEWFRHRKERNGSSD